MQPKAYLLTDAQITEALVSRGCGNQSASYDVMQTAIRTKVEGILEVDTLVRGTSVEVGYLGREMAPEGFIFRNGFLVEGQPVVYENPANIEFAPRWVDRRLGVLRNPSATRYVAGEYQFTYTSGFEIDPDTHVLQDVPDFIITLATSVLASWIRTMPMNMAVVKDISYAQYVAAPLRDIRSQMYTHYQRPRAGLIATEALSYVAG